MIIYTKYSNISKSFQVMPFKFAVKIVRLKVYMIFSQPDDLDQSRSQLCLTLKVDKS